MAVKQAVLAAGLGVTATWLPRRMGGCLMFRHRFTVVALGVIVLMLVAVGTAHTSTILVDDFNDGNDDGWTRGGYMPGPPVGPAIFDATFGAYHLMSSGLVPVDTPHYLASYWDDSTHPLFADGLLRSKIRVDAEGTIAWLFMRSTGGSGYIFAADTATSEFSIQGGAENALYAPLDEPAFNVGEEWNIEGGAIGDQITLKVWRVGDPEPSVPQVVVTDVDFRMGELGVGANVSGLPYPEPAFVDATFDDIYFTPIPPLTQLSVPAATIYTVKDTDSDPAFDNSGDSASSKMSAFAAAVGERDTLDSNSIVRLVAKFDLLPISEAARCLERATIRVFLEDIAGTPASPVSLFHSADDNDLEESPSDFEDVSYEDTLLDLVQPTDVGQTYYELDVTDLVRADYTGDGNDPLSAFRLQVNEAVFLEDDQSHRYRFTMPRAGANPPELVLTFIPEPSTLLLCIIPLGLVVGWHALAVQEGRRRTKTSHRALAVAMAATLSSTIAHAVTIETVPVGTVGNAPDQDFGDGRFGEVAYTYRIGKFEVKNSEYTLFLNRVDPTGENMLGLYDPAMDWDVRGGTTFGSAAPDGAKYGVKAGRGDNPVAFVNWYDAIRFANWLHNDQGGPGSTEDGAYTLLGGISLPSNAANITRNAGARWFLPTEDEWYKAAYHQPASQGGDTDDYWLFPTRTNAEPFSDEPPGSDAPTQSNTANFDKDDNTANGYDDGWAVIGSPCCEDTNLLSDVGAYTESRGFYGTFDQSGNVEEWTETGDESSRVIRGGGWGHSSDGLAASSRPRRNPFFLETHNGDAVGFRVASVPEPSSLMLAAFGLLGGGLLRAGCRTCVRFESPIRSRRQTRRDVPRIVVCESHQSRH